MKKQDEKAVDLREACENLFNQDYFHTLTLEDLSITFLESFYSKEIDTDLRPLSVDALRYWYCQYETSKKENEVPYGQEFYKFICVKYLDIDSSPVLEFAKIYQEYMEVLDLIDKRIEGCNTLIKSIPPKEQQTYIDKLNLGLYESFKESNLELREIIAQRLLDKDLLRCRVLSASRKSPLKRLCANDPILDCIDLYDDSYDAKEFSRLTNKLKYLSLKDDERIYLKNQEKNAVNSVAESQKLTEALLNIIKEREVVKQLRACLNSSPLLKSRFSILHNALDFFERQEYLLFCNLIPIQIEGIFQDYTSGWGVKFSEDQLSMLPKIKSLEKIDYLEEWLYFKFRFPVIRNAVAHGSLNERSIPSYFNLNLTGIATELLLDLFDVCKRTIKEGLPVNYIYHLIDKIEADKIKPADTVKLSILSVMNFHFEVIDIAPETVLEILKNHCSNSYEIYEFISGILEYCKDDIKLASSIKLAIEFMGKHEILSKDDKGNLLRQIKERGIHTAKLKNLDIPSVWDSLCIYI